MSRERGTEELLGDLDGPVAAVDRKGTVAPIGEEWTVGWAAGAENGWHVAAAEAAVRTRMIDGMPVTATMMRVPGGDVTLRAAAGRAAAGTAVVLEFSNDTPMPVSLAVGVTGSMDTASVRGARLLVDGRVAVDLGRAPRGTAAVGDGDVWRAVRAGPSAGDCEARSRAGQAAAAAIVPLAPRVPLRVTVAAEGWSGGDCWAGGGSPEKIAAGCSEPATLTRAAVVLDRLGLPDEADRARRALVAEAGRSSLPSPVAAAALRALASRRLRADRVSGLAELAGPLAEAAGDRLDALTLEQVAAVLEVEAPAAARDARRLLAGAASPTSASRSVAGYVDLAGTVRRSVAFGGDGIDGVEALLGCLVAEAPDHLVTAPFMPDEWAGAPVDARGLLTRHGVLSFSVRWHGARPALLWELAPAGGHCSGRDLDGVTLRCGLDPSWSAPGSAGDVLLGL